MTHIPGPGTAEPTPTVCLLPTGSANESIEGLSHFFEHFFIGQLRSISKKNKITGHTTEDYVILFCYGLTPADVMDGLVCLRRPFGESLFEKSSAKTFAKLSDLLSYHKKRLREEIEEEQANREELFFRFVWRGTGYEKSPLGTPSGIDAINIDVLERFCQGLLKKEIYFYTLEKGVQIFNGPAGGVREPEPGSEPVKCLTGKAYENTDYDIYYFKGDIERLYLLARILKHLNPGRHIQLSEKKNMTALIVETGSVFPSRDNIGNLREQALAGIKEDIAEIQTNFSERALNELESMYYRGIKWQERIERLIQVTDHRLFFLT
jgi:hypothetical protein